MNSLIVGLGNPGEKYKYTRHNVGFIILDYILNEKDWSYSEKAKTFFIKKQIGKKEVEYLKPQTFMNNSGASVVYAQKKHKIKTKDIIIIYDDIDLPLGKIKISFNRSSGGHNGVGSIIKVLKTEEFLRIRIGICPTTPTGKNKKPKGEDKILKFLLGEFKKEELDILKKVAKNVSEGIEIIENESYQKAMTLFN
ncbi:MAG: aminoacyl-tRNA hydrolase [Candidatus Pacebacteria bacterium]|nr:aminoacyl-tRNA hydrolase [Candidatus Paceibacterota bacterium]